MSLYVWVRWLYYLWMMMFFGGGDRLVGGVFFGRYFEVLPLFFSEDFL